MTIMKITIDEKEIYACIVNGVHEFRALTKKLLENVTKKQIDQITTCIHNKYIILHRDLINCYSCNGEKIISDETCLCGKKNINEVYSLENTETHKKFNIGSTCVSNWISKKKINTKI